MSAAFGINVSGMIAGYSSTADGTVHATRWTDHTSAPQDLGSLKVGGNSYARGINNKGQVVGYADSNAR
jgi:probable HAF family extracellular repeat protein